MNTSGQVVQRNPKAYGARATAAPGARFPPRTRSRENPSSGCVIHHPLHQPDGAVISDQLDHRQEARLRAECGPEGHSRSHIGGNSEISTAGAFPRRRDKRHRSHSRRCCSNAGRRAFIHDAPPSGRSAWRTQFTPVLRPDAVGRPARSFSKHRAMSIFSISPQTARPRHGPGVFFGAAVPRLRQRLHGDDAPTGTDGARAAERRKAGTSQLTPFHSTSAELARFAPLG